MIIINIYIIIYTYIIYIHYYHFFDSSVSPLGGSASASWDTCNLARGSGQPFSCNSWPAWSHWGSSNPEATGLFVLLLTLVFEWDTGFAVTV